MLKRDSLRFGVFLGLIAPLIGLVVYYLVQFRNITSLGGFFHYILTEKSLLTAMVSILLVANAGIFTWYINSRKDRTAKGIFLSTSVYGISALVWKFFT